jgi:hypothetical protein
MWYDAGMESLLRGAEWIWVYVFVIAPLFAWFRGLW